MSIGKLSIISFVLVLLIFGCAEEKKEEYGGDDSSYYTYTPEPDFSYTPSTSYSSSIKYVSPQGDSSASGSLTVGASTVSGTYTTPCFYGSSVDTLTANGFLPSDTKAFGFVFVLTDNDNATREYILFTDTSCTDVNFLEEQLFDNLSIGDQSGSNYKFDFTLKKMKFLAKTSAAKTWADSNYSTEFTIGTKVVTDNNTAYKSLINVSGDTIKTASPNTSSYPTEVSSIEYVKQ